MEGARPPSPEDELELSVLEGQPDEQTPLNGAAQVIPFSAEDPCPAQVRFPWCSPRHPSARRARLPAGFPASSPRATNASRAGKF